jgi:hypothetical protein
MRLCGTCRSPLLVVLCGVVSRRRSRNPHATNGESCLSSVRGGRFRRIDGCLVHLGARSDGSRTGVLDTIRGSVGTAGALLPDLLVYVRSWRLRRGIGLLDCGLAHFLARIRSILCGCGAC